MFRLHIEEAFSNVISNFHTAILQCTIQNCAYSSALWNYIEQEITALRQQYELSTINSRSSIATTRDAYKMLGKDPNRYRPSAEALCRRIIKGDNLYKINAAVDCINIISLLSGHSIGGFDIDKISGDTLVLGVGCGNEPFNAIGRGMLNIENLPVYRDALGAIGTPTSDHERTKIDLQTQNLLLVINAYDGKEAANATLELSKYLLQKFLNADVLKESIITI